MPSKSKKQARFMAAVAHGWKPDGVRVPPVSVAREFNKADKGTGILKKAEGGKVKPSNKDKVHDYYLMYRKKGFNHEDAIHHALAYARLASAMRSQWMTLDEGTGKPKWGTRPGIIDETLSLAALPKELGIMDSAPGWAERASERASKLGTALNEDMGLMPARGVEGHMTEAAGTMLAQLPVPASALKGLARYLKPVSKAVEAAPVVVRAPLKGAARTLGPAVEWFSPTVDPGLKQYLTGTLFGGTLGILGDSAVSEDSDKPGYLKGGIVGAFLRKKRGTETRGQDLNYVSAPPIRIPLNPMPSTQNHDFTPFGGDYSRYGEGLQHRFFAKGGLAQAAEEIRRHGRGGDDILIHVNPDEYQDIQDAWGEPSYNPHTGLPEYGLFSKIKKALKFEKFNIGKMWDAVKKNPQRLFIGAVDPIGTKIANKVTGSNFKPMVNQLGGPTSERYAQAEAKGIDTGLAKDLHKIAGTVAGFYGGQGLASLASEGVGALAQSAGVPSNTAGTLMQGATKLASKGATLATNDAMPPALGTLAEPYDPGYKLDINYDPLNRSYNPYGQDYGTYGQRNAHRFFAEGGKVGALAQALKKVSSMFQGEIPTHADRDDLLWGLRHVEGVPPEHREALTILKNKRDLASESGDLDASAEFDRALLDRLAEIYTNPGIRPIYKAVGTTDPAVLQAAQDADNEALKKFHALYTRPEVVPKAHGGKVQGGTQAAVATIHDAIAHIKAGDKDTAAEILKSSDISDHPDIEEVLQSLIGSNLGP